MSVHVMQSWANACTNNQSGIWQQCNSQKIGGILAGSSEGKNEQQTKDGDNISVDCETMQYDLKL